MRYLPLIAACACLASPAMAGGTTFIEKTTPPTELETCTIKLRDTSDILQQLIRKVSAPAAVIAAPAAQPKPVVKASARPRTCPVLRNRQRCKPGRTQSPKHNCKCGVWS